MHTTTAPTATAAPANLHANQSLFWLVANWPHSIYWSSLPPQRLYGHLPTPISWERTLSQYQPSSDLKALLLKSYTPAPKNVQAPQPPKSAKGAKGLLWEVIDASAPLFTPQKLHTLWADHHAYNQLLHTPALAQYPHQAHEMVLRTLTHGVCWTQVWQKLFVEVADIAQNTYLQAPFFPNSSSAVAYCTYYATKHSTTPDIDLNIGVHSTVIPFKLTISPAPTDPTEYGTVLLQLPNPQLLQLCDWHSLLQFLTVFRQNLALRKIHLVLPM